MPFYRALMVYGTEFALSVLILVIIKGKAMSLSQNTILNLNPVQNNSVKKGANSETTSEGQDFLSSLVQAIDETNEFLPQNLKISEKELVNEAMDQLQKGTISGFLDGEVDQISIFESLSFMELLGVLEQLKIQSSDVKLGNLSNLTQELLQTQSNLDILKKANSLDELFDLAKSLNLNVSKIKVDRLLDLKTTFPNLDKADFFKNSIESVFKDLLNSKIANIIKESSVKQNSTNKTQETKTNDLLSKALQSINLDKDTDTLVKTDKTQSESVKQNLNELLQNKNSSKETLNNKNLNEENIKLANTTQEKNVKIQDNSFALDTKQSQSVKEAATLIATETNTKDTKIQNELNKTSLNLSAENKEQIKQAISANTNSSSQDKNQENKSTQESTNQQQNNIQNKETDDTQLNSFVRDLSRVSSNELKNQVNLKETFSQFSQDLKEQMQNFKSPITRLNITLNPSNLGEVEVTLIQRGNNLHISFNTNTNAMNLFLQNQAEFKSSLVNMGFTGLEMNFSDQSKKDNQQQAKNKKASDSSLENLETQNESANVNLEMVLAKYF